MKPGIPALVLLSVLIVGAQLAAGGTDRYGDPLPEGASARLGTLRGRHGLVTSLAFLPDGKTLAAAGGRAVLCDATTLKEIRRIGAFALALSPDGKTAAVSGDTVRLVNVGDGKEIRRFQPVKDGWIQSLAFSPDGKKVVGGNREKPIHVWSVANGKEEVQLQEHKDAVELVSFSADGKTLLSVGGHMDHTLIVWDTATWKALHRFGKGHVVGAAFTPDSKAVLATVNGELTFWDVATGKEVRNLPPFDGSHRRTATAITFSPDGKSLAVADGSIHVLDVKSAKEIRQLPQLDRSVAALAFSPDGKRLAVGDGHVISLWDLRTGEALHPTGHEHGVPYVAFGPDGKTLLSGGWDRTARLWDLTGARERRRFQGSALEGHVVCSPDGKSLVVGCPYLRIVDVESGKERGPYKDEPIWASPVAFSPDSKTFLTIDKYSRTFEGGLTCQLWDTASGEKRRQLIPWFDKERPQKATGGSILAAAVAPDGKTVAMSWETSETRRRFRLVVDERISLWDVETGEERRRIKVRASTLAFTPDGTRLISGTRGENCGIVQIRDVATGNELRRWEVPPPYDDMQIALSPDGKTLATAGKSRVYVWETITGRERRRFAGHEGTILSLAFSSDGRALASGSSDTTILVWDLMSPGAEGKSAARPPAAERQHEWWTRLASADAAEAYRAIGELVRAKKEAVALLEKQLNSAPAGDAARIARAIADLDKDQFVLREKAADALESLGEAAEPALRETLAKVGSSLEVRRRIERVLQRLEPTASAERLRMVGAIETLERIGSPQAQDILQSLAKGFPQALQTREAKACLERLARQEKSREAKQP